MSPPLNPNAQSFQPKSSSSSLTPLIHLPNPTILPSSLLPPSGFLPVHPHPHHHHHLQVPAAPSFYHHQFTPKQQICYGFPPPPPPKVISDYTHHASMMILATLNLFKDSSSIGGTGCFLKTTSTTGRSKKCSKKLQLLPSSPPPPPPPPSPLHHRSCCSTTKKQQWQRKSVVQVKGGGGGRGAASAPANGGVVVPKPPPFSSEQVQRFGKKTSVMIKNIPSRFCRNMLVDLLVDHCKKENAKEVKSEEEDLNKSAFDFVYLPIDFETDCNKGYAFVNFTNPNGVWRLYEYLNNYEWDVFNSRKICEVAYARIQGKGSLIRHFNRSTFACEKDEYLPVYFNPFLDGSAQDDAVEVGIVGTRSMPSPLSQQLSILRRGDDHHVHQQVQRNHDEDEKYGEEVHP